MEDLKVLDEREVLGKEFKMYGTKENPLFLAKDVANWIEHTHTTRMLERVDEDEKLNGIIVHAGQKREMTFLTEDGLYEVLMQSRKPIAKAFKKEVKQILKQIRMTGGYIPTTQEDDEETILAKAFLIAQRTIEKKNKLIEEMTPRVNWFDKFMSSEGLYTSTQVAKVLHISSAKRLNTILNEEKIIYKQGGSWLPYVSTDKSWYKLIVGSSENHSYSQLKFTPKGIYEISKILDVSLKEEDVQSV
jgi:prophage antirepressor-like protein